MGDHFVLLVDRLLTESTLGAAIENRNRFTEATAPAIDEERKAINPSHRLEFGDVVSPGKLVECRICQDEDEDRNMETPCSCCGSLKYAHRRCVQRWCNEKGNTVCEICHQQFKPGYTAPPPLFHLGRIPMSFRGNWEVYRGESHNGPRFVTMVSADRSFSHPEYQEQSTSFTRSLMWCRSIAIIFMVLLVLRHTLPILISGSNVYSFPLLMLLFLRTAGVVLPIYLIMRVLSAIQRHRYRQAPFLHTTMVSPRSSFTSSDDEAEQQSLQPQAQVIQ